MSSSALFVGILLLYSIIAPAFRGPDEPHHFDLVREWSLDWEYRVLDRQISSQVFGTLGVVEFFDRSEHLEQAGALDRSERPSFADMGPESDSPQYNQISQHPPLYYVLLGTADWGVDAVEPGPRWAFDREIALVRLLTIAMLAPVPWLIFATSRRLGMSAPAALSASLVPATIPQFVHIGSTVNNDNLVIALSAVLGLLCVRAFDDGRRRIALAMGVVAGLMLLTKGFGIIAPPMVGMAYLLSWRRGQTTARASLINVAISGATTILVAGWWYVRNIIKFGTPQPSRLQLPLAAEGFDPDAGFWWQNFAKFVPNRFFGDFGWFDVQIGRSWVLVGMIVLTVGALVAVVAPQRSAGLTRPVAIGFLVPFAILLAYLLIGTWKGYTLTSQLPGMQGRYLFPAIPFLAPVIASGWDRMLGRARPALPLLVLAYGFAFQIQGVKAMLGFYWAPPSGSLRDQVAAMVSWAPWPPLVFVAIVGILIAAFSLLTAASVALALPAPNNEPPDTL